MHLGPKWRQVGSRSCKGPVAAREMQQHSLLAPDLASASDEGEDEMEVTMAHGFLWLGRQKGKSHAQKPFLGSLEAVWRCRMRRTWKKHQKIPFNRKTGEACDPVCRWRQPQSRSYGDQGKLSICNGRVCRSLTTGRRRGWTALTVVWTGKLSHMTSLKAKAALT